MNRFQRKQDILYSPCVVYPTMLMMLGCTLLGSTTTAVTALHGLRPTDRKLIVLMVTTWYHGG